MRLPRRWIGSSRRTPDEEVVIKESNSYAYPLLARSCGKGRQEGALARLGVIQWAVMLAVLTTAL
jgi:hypothetical protein